MRSATLVTALALTLAAGLLQGAPPEPPADVSPGRVAWFDITTSDLSQSKGFYGQLFDWSFAALEGTDLALEIVAQGEGIGTLRLAEGKISPFNGVIYVRVADVRASCARSQELGGTVAPGFPFNLPDASGAIALVFDPSGHPVGLYSKMLLPAVTPTAK